MNNLLLNTKNSLIGGACSLASVATTAVSTIAQGAQDAYNGLQNTATKAQEVASNALSSVRTGLAFVGSQLRSNPQAVPELVGGAYDAFNRSAEELFSLGLPNENDAELTHELVLANNDKTFTSKSVTPAPASPRSVTKAEQLSSDKKVKLIAFLGFLYLLLRFVSIWIKQDSKAAHKWLGDEIHILENGARATTSLVGR